jgi:rod shape-determining protein MreC
MAKGRFSYYPLAIAAVFILLEAVSLVMLKRSSTLQDIWLNRLSHNVMGKLWGGGESIRNHFSLQKQNDALRDENFRLSERLRTYELGEEAARERSAGIKPDDRKFNYIPATVVKASRNTIHNYIILNKGRADGVKPHSGIISDCGVVGIVSAVDEHYSYGLTMMNTKISVSARVGASGLVAPLVWDGRTADKAYLTDIPLQYQVAEKDTVFTSGFSSIFPAGLPIGVTGLSNMVNGSTNRTEVYLFQSFSALHYVTIVDNPERDEIEALEAADEEKEGRK